MKQTSLYSLFLAHPVVTTDSRNTPAGSIFIALKGDKFDGNLYARKALENGCAYAVVDETEVVEPNDSRYILVPDALKAFQDLAHEHREHCHCPVIEVTGTNGKTTTKELLAAVLGKKFNVLATEGNNNNHIGVPKTLLRLTQEHTIAIIETGANHPGEIKTLANIVDPDCGLITNVGKAHLEGFGSFEGVIKTKGELYDYLRKKKDGFIFLNGDNEHLSKIAQGLKTVKYGHSAHADYLVEGSVTDCSPYLCLRWRPTDNSDWQEVKTHLIGAYNIDNVLAAACAGTYFGIAPKQINEALEAYVPKNDRSELRITKKNHLIVDAYNANPTSMAAALDNFKQMNGDHKMVILGDMRELGSASEQEHQKVVEFLKKANFEQVWLVGENFSKTNHDFRIFKDVEEVKQALQAQPVEGKLILVKGSNGTKLFQLPDLL